MADKTYTLEGKSYTVPADTTMDELDEYIKSQGDQLTRQANETAKAAGVNNPLQRAPLPAMHSDADLPAGLSGKPMLGEPLAPPIEGNLRAASQVPGILKGLWTGAKVLGRTTAGAATGAAVGGYGGGALGNLVGQHDLGAKIGATLGGLVGGYGAATLQPEAAAEVDPVAQAVKNRTASWIPTRIKPELAPAELDPVAEAVKNRTANWIPTKIKPSAKVDPLAPSTSGGVPGVNIIPEPRPLTAADRPGSQWSVKRKTGLIPAARRGVPGAGDVLSNLSTVIYEPREGVGYGGPRVDAGIDPAEIEAPPPQSIQSTTASPGAATLNIESGSRIPEPKKTVKRPQ